MKQEIIELLNKAWARTKERFKPLVFFLISLFITEIVLGLSAIFAIAYPHPLYLILAILGGLLVFLLIYLLFYLATIDVLIAENKQGVRETLKKIKPRLWGFVRLNLLYGIFTIGLLPLGVLTASVVWVLWVLWSVFIYFIYLEKNKKGLENLWISRAMVRGRFWDSAGKMFIVFAPILAVALLIGLIKNEVLKGMLNMVFGLLVYPFSISFLYELYKTLPEAHTAKPPKVWIILSLIGWVLVILFIVFVLPFLLRESNFIPCTDTVSTRCLTS